MKKFMMILVIMIVGFVIMPSVYADGEWFGEVESSIGSDTLLNNNKPETIGSKTENVEMTYDNVELKYVKKDDFDDGAWVGMKVTAPKEVTDANNVTYYRIGEESNIKKFADLKDGGTGGENPFYIYIYVQVTKEKLQEAASKGIETLNLGTWVFKWDKDGSHTQNITININTTTTTLKDLNSEEIFTPEEATQLIEESKKPKPTEQPVKTEEKVEENKNPDTADINLSLLFSVLAISTLGLGYTFKKRFN